MQETWVQPLVREDPLEKGMAIQSAFLPGESHGQRSLAGYSPWGLKKLDMTEQQTHTFYGFNLSLCLLALHSGKFLTKKLKRKHMHWGKITDKSH